jgi:predicted transcriptional regulator
MKDEGEGLELENRRRIYQYVASRPGTHMRQIERDLAMAPGLLTYHLEVLEKRGLLRSEVQGNRRCFFPAKAFHRSQRRLVGLLRQRVPRLILLLLLRSSPRTFAGLQAEVGVSPSTLSYHLKKLDREGAVVKGRREKESTYEVRDREMLLDLLVAHGPSLGRDVVEEFADLWDKLRVA